VATATYIPQRWTCNSPAQLRMLNLQCGQLIYVAP